MVLGKVMGGTSLATIQGLVFLALAPTIGIRFGAEQFAMVVLLVFLVAFALTAVGFCVAWVLDSTQAFHAIINLFLIPLWMLSGALFSISGASGWLRAVMKANPLTYGVEGLRATLFPAVPSSLPITTSLGVLAGFCAVMLGVAYVVAERRSSF